MSGRKGVWRRGWEGVDLGGARSRGKRGKRQLLGLRPLLMLLVLRTREVTPGCCFFRPFGGGNGRGGGRRGSRGVTKCLQVRGERYPSAPLQPQRLQCPPKGWEHLCPPHTPKAPGSQAVRGWETAWSGSLLSAPPGRGRAPVEEGRAIFWHERAASLGPLPAHSYFLTQLVLLHGGHPWREQAVRSANLLWQ